MKKFLSGTKTILLAVVWCCLALVVFAGLTTILKPKWYEDSYWEAATKIEDGFYALEDNSIDVLFMGSSHAFRGFNPLELYKQYGITSYVFSGSTQRTWTTLTYLQEALKTQNPKVVVIDSYCFFTVDQNDESRNHKQFDYLKFSESKLEGLETAVNEDEKLLDYALPLLYYHSRWSDLNRNDFTYLGSEKNYYLRGYDLTFSVTNVNTEDWHYDWPCGIYGVLNFYNPDENKARRALDEICKLCQEKGIQLFFTAVPTTDWHLDEAECVQSLADEYGFTFVDYCMEENFISTGIDTVHDFQDNGYHLNVWGAQKFAAAIGRELQQRYGLDDHRGGADDAEWQADITEYEARLAANKAVPCTELNEYLNQISQLDDNYLICAVGNKKWREELDESDLSKLSQVLGMNVDDFAQISYFCNIEDGLRYISQKSYTLNKNVNGVPFCIKSNTRTIQVNGNNAAKGRDGLNIVIYNKMTGTVEDSCSITRNGVVH